MHAESQSVPLCAVCGERPQRNRGFRRQKRRYGPACNPCYQASRGPLLPKMPIPESRPFCTSCQNRPCRLKARTHSKVYFFKTCAKCKRDEKRLRGTYAKWHYLRHRKDRCEECGFVAVHIAQLEIDHVDGNHSNNDVSNLRTLCANCHRLKTMIERGLHTLDKRRCA